MLLPETRRLTLDELAEACQVEASRFRAGETKGDGFCHELVRRAVCERDDAAWAILMAQYRGLVLSWVQQHPASRALAEDGDYWVTAAFERFWMAVGPERFAAFGSFGAIAQYLKMCVHSVLLDEVRAGRSRPTALDETVEEADSGVDVEGQLVRRVSGQEVWAAIARALPDAASRAAIYLSFALDLRPREIYARYPQHYASVADVYRSKRNALDRLRRDPELRARYGDAGLLTGT
jgi:hypothetical protein